MQRRLRWRCDLRLAVVGLSLAVSSGCATPTRVVLTEERPVAVPVQDVASRTTTNPALNAPAGQVRYETQILETPGLSEDAHVSSVQIDNTPEPLIDAATGEPYGRLIDPGNLAVNEPVLNTAPRQVDSIKPAPRSVPPSNQNRGLGIRLTDFASQWAGVKYQWGGNDRRGIDCSGLVLRLYKDLFDITLPRTTRQQIRAGKAIERQQLALGDLVFFRLPRNRRHVGVFLGDGRFLHASRSRGVVVSSMDKAFWRRHYQRAVRPAGRST